MEELLPHAQAPSFGVETLKSPAPGVELIKLRGDMDMAVRDRLRAALGQASAGRVVVLDVEAVTYADSTSLAEMIRLRKAVLAAGGVEVRLVGPGAVFGRLLELTDLTKVFPVFATLEEALGAGGI